MGMLLRRERKPEVEPKVNGKPVVKEPKTRKLHKEPVYATKVERQITGINDLVRK